MNLSTPLAKSALLLVSTRGTQQSLGRFRCYIFEQCSIKAPARNSRQESTMKNGKYPSETVAEFKSCVNMDAKELEEWLKTNDSNKVGWAPGGGESRGHESGRIIVELLQKEEDEYDEADFHHVSRVISYVHRHRAQGPSKHSVETSKWRYSPMNWGNDPLKDLE